MSVTAIASNEASIAIVSPMNGVTADID